MARPAESTASGRPGLSYRLVVEPSPDAADLAMLEDRLAVAAVTAAGMDEREFGIFLRGDDGKAVGGISGVILGRCCELQAMWVDESLRMRGLGRALVAAAEAHARSSGCALVMLHAYDALTPNFYDRIGYRTVGVVEDCLADAPLRWYAKDLSAG